MDSIPFDRKAVIFLDTSHFSRTKHLALINEQILTTYLRKSWDLASTISVSIPSG